MKVPRDDLPTGHAGMQQRLRRGPRIDPTAYVVPGAVVLGDVTVGEDSSVWYGAILRGDINRIVIGARSNLQDGVILHVADDNAAVIGELVTVGHGAIVHACTVGDEVLVGMGAIILDGANIGSRSIIGANALVTAGMRIPAGSMVLGSPARVTRQLSEDEQGSIKRWALKYVENARLFREHFTSPPR